MNPGHPLPPCLAALAVLAAACGPPMPGPLTRVAGWEPRGEGAAADAVVRIEFTAPVDPAGLLDGRRLALARGADARALVEALESEAGGGPGSPAIPCAVTLEPGGLAVRLVPQAPLAAGTIHALVLASRARDAEGRPILDPDGRHRTFLATFTTLGAPPGPPPRLALTEVRAAAATPQAGGEYVEVANLGEAAVDLEGFRLEKRTAGGATAGCRLVLAVGGPLAPGALALVTGGAWDGRYGVPPGTPRYACGATALAGGLADDTPPELRLLDAAGALVATLGEGATAPRCDAAVERIHPGAPDEPGAFTCAEGSPGRCNDATPAADCAGP